MPVHTSHSESGSSCGVSKTWPYPENVMLPFTFLTATHNTKVLPLPPRPPTCPRPLPRHPEALRSCVKFVMKPRRLCSAMSVICTFVMRTTVTGTSTNQKANRAIDVHRWVRVAPRRLSRVRWRVPHLPRPCKPTQRRQKYSVTFAMRARRLCSARSAT
jgi:hypothetical protein